MHDGATRLPDGAFEAAMERYRDLQSSRVRAMFNRHRAVFAESLVAELLGAVESPDPTHAWDLSWPRPGGPDVRIQVKCSGGYLPRMAHRSTEAPARWDVKEPAYGWQDHDEREQQRLGPGHHCEVFVLARHSGCDIESGWSFSAVPTHLIQGATTRAGKPRRHINPAHLERWGLPLVPPTEPVDAVAAAAALQTAQR